MFEIVLQKFSNFSVLDLLCILFVGALLSFSFTYFNRRNAEWYSRIVVVLIAICCLLSLAGIFPKSFVFWVLFPCLAVISVVLFANDLRRDVFKLSWKSKNHFVAKDNDLGVEDVEDLISKIVKSCQSMAKQDIGALIVVVSETISDYILESGTKLNAEVSSELLETLFFPNTPLHDGAVVIKGNTVLAASCYLPLSQSANIAKDLGTRHRAAVGLTEANPTVTAIVVSEETGIISSVKDGLISRYLDAEGIKKALEKAYGINVKTSSARGD